MCVCIWLCVCVCVLLLTQNLGLQLEYILAKEHADRLSVIDDIKDDNRRKELRTEDEEEDFLDEGNNKWYSFYHCNTLLLPFAWTVWQSGKKSSDFQNVRYGKKISDVQNVWQKRSLMSRMSDLAPKNLWHPKCQMWQKDLCLKCQIWQKDHWHPKCRIWYKDLWHPKCQIWQKDLLRPKCEFWQKRYLMSKMSDLAPQNLWHPKCQISDVQSGKKISDIQNVRSSLSEGSALCLPIWGLLSMCLPILGLGSICLPIWGLGSICLPVWGLHSICLPIWGLRSICLPIWGLHSMHLSIWRLSSIHLPIWRLRSMHLPICLCPASINPRGTDCPYAVKMLACLVLLEITTFLRETFQYLPRTRSQKREHGWDKPVTTRRFSSIVSSPGHSDKSSESNIGELPSGMSEFWLFFSFSGVCVCVFMWERERGVCLCARESVHICVYVWESVCAYVFVCMWERGVYACECLCIYMRTCMWGVCMYVCGVCVCMYVHCGSW